MKNTLLDLLNLYHGEENKQKVLDNVKSNIHFTGSNLWILACAIIIASVGLNLNSTAVIIGAMLISPLMGPIVGSGFALGIYDFDLLKKSLFNLIIATIVSLSAATIYFLVTPFKDAQSELLARISPTIYDVLIAFFGGLVGVITITRVEKGNPIPGVAIATALMPPLCTAGYGLALGYLNFFFSALYLYSINCVFICISTYLIVKYLKYPAIKMVDGKNKRRVQFGITLIVVFMLLPSGYFAFSLYKEQKFKHNTDIFIEKEFTEKGNTVVYKKTKYSTNISSIELAFLKSSFNDEEVKILNDRLKSYGLTNTILSIKQNSSDNLKALKSDILNEINKKEVTLNEKDQKILILEAELMKNTFDSRQLYEEIIIIFPNIKSLSLANHTYASKDTMINRPVLILETKPKLSIVEQKKIINWVEKKLSLFNLELICNRWKQ